jgi:hypothetical protein
MNNHLMELEELREDVISDLSELIREVEYMDFDSLKNIAYAIGTLDKSEEGIDIHVTYEPENISHYFPEGTPTTVLLDCLQSIKETLSERVSYDTSEMLLVLKNDMYETFTDYIATEVCEKFSYSLVEKNHYTLDREDFAMVLSAVKQDRHVYVIVKFEPKQEYSVWELSEKPEYEDLAKETVQLWTAQAEYVGNIRLAESE